jgi:hypothetical protein
VYSYNTPNELKSQWINRTCIRENQVKRISREAACRGGINKEGGSTYALPPSTHRKGEILVITLARLHLGVDGTQHPGLLLVLLHQASQEVASA